MKIGNKVIRFNIKEAKKARLLKEKGLSYREVMRAMKKKDTKSIWRLLRYEIPKGY